MAKIVLPVLSNTLPKDDPRYQKWLKSLTKRPPPWNKGQTTETSVGVKKTSETFKRKRIDNFANWREEARKKGLIPSSYPPFRQSENLALFTGLVLGDGNIHKFPRTEKLTLALGTDKPELIEFSKRLTKEVFSKEPYVFKPKGENVVKITVYQKLISKRLKVPTGNRRNSEKGIPSWIWKSKRYLTACLRGLFEAEGSLSIHLPSYTYNFSFSNRNKKLLHDVKTVLIKLGFHPETRSNAIRLRKKEEVLKFKSLISFRSYLG